MCWARGGEPIPEDEGDPSRAAPPGPYTGLDWDIWVGDAVYSCGLTESGEVVCWGLENLPPEREEFASPDPPPGMYSAIRVESVNQGMGIHSLTACALADTGDVVCWGSEHSHLDLERSSTRLRLLATDGATLRLHPRVTVDAREAEALAARITDRSQPLPEDGHHEILALEPLPDWDEDWADRARAGLQGRFLRALDGYARRLASRGDVDEALAVAQQAWNSDPLHESTVGVLIEIHVAGGNRGQALRVYDALDRQLEAERGIEPSEALRALVAPLLPRRPRS